MWRRRVLFGLCLVVLAVAVADPLLEDPLLADPIDLTWDFVEKHPRWTAARATEAEARRAFGAAAADEVRVVRLLTTNVWNYDSNSGRSRWPDRRRMLVHMLRVADADMVSLQEVREDICHDATPNQLMELLVQPDLQHLRGYWQPAQSFFPKDCQQEGVGLMTAWTFRRLAGVALPRDGSDGNQRTLLLARLTDRAPRAPRDPAAWEVVLGAVHWSYQKDGQISNARATLNATEHLMDSPAFLLGDFNIYPEFEDPDAVLRQVDLPPVDPARPRFADAWEDVRPAALSLQQSAPSSEARRLGTERDEPALLPGATWRYGPNNLRLGRRPDRIYYRRGRTVDVRPLQCFRLGFRDLALQTMHSDHYALFCDFALHRTTIAAATARSDGNGASDSESVEFQSLPQAPTDASPRIAELAVHRGGGILEHIGSTGGFYAVLAAIVLCACTMALIARVRWRVAAPAPPPAVASSGGV